LALSTITPEIVGASALSYTAARVVRPYFFNDIVNPLETVSKRMASGQAGHRRFQNYAIFASCRSVWLGCSCGSTFYGSKASWNRSTQVRILSIKAITRPVDRAGVEFPRQAPFNLITPTTVNRTQGLQVTEVLSENLEYLLASARPTGKELQQAMFDRVFHADWSCDPKKRWLAAAERRGDAWKVDAPKPASTTAELLILIHRCRQNSCRALFGFDFPIGLPITFGRQIEFEGFVHALSEFGGGPWQAFFRVADRPEEISIWRPFYPNTSRRGRRHSDMFEPLGVSSMNELRRECELKTELKPAACPLL
jgi:hypothetical protein